jgi:hypothetical protein
MEECREEEERFMKVAVTVLHALGDVCTTSNLANMKTGQTTNGLSLASPATAAGRNYAFQAP